jgi:FkbM family methyltransferase
MDAILSCRALPLLRAVPVGLSWLYDVQRFAGTRDLTVILDVGANIGQTAHDLVRYFPRSAIYCFEPGKAAYAELTKTYRRFANVTCINAALADRLGTAQLELHTNSELNTLAGSGQQRQFSTGEFETVDMTMLDAFCAARGITHIDILKMDVQGFELRVIAGGANLFRQHRVHFVYSEVNFGTTFSDVQHFHSFNERMMSLGFIFSGVYGTARWGPAKAYVNFANVLYTNPNFTNIKDRPR